MAPARFHVWRWRLIALWVVIFTLVVAYSVRQTHQLSTTTHTSLCSFVNDLRQSRDSTAGYLADHPQGLVARNGEILISAAQLGSTLARQTRTLKSLEGLGC